MGSSVAVAERSGKASALRVLMWLVPFVGFLIAGWAWALSSPVGSSPDDDYHMASIWCPTPLESSGCLVGHTDEGLPIVKVPELVALAVCYAYNPEASGACQLEFRGETQTTRVDNGGYPGGYYDFVHIFVSNSVLKSVYSIRLLNVAIAAVMILTTVAVTPKKARLPMIGGFIVGMIPLGIFLIASLNPSSWAITGVCVAWGATHALLSSDTPLRRALASVMLVLGATLAATSRADAGAFVVVVTAGYLAIQYRKSVPWTSIGVIGLASIIGVIGFLSGGQSTDIMTDTPVDEQPSLSLIRIVALLVNNIIDLPSLIGGVFGYAWGLGWLDTFMPGITVLSILLAVGGLLFLGTQQVSIRKITALVMTMGAAASVALMVLQANKIAVGTVVQPRYILPLVLVFLMILLVDAHHPERSLHMRGSTRWLLWSLVIIANTFALQQNIRRYTTGIDKDGLNLNRDVEWWISSVPPMTLWILGSIGFALFASALLYVGREAKPEVVEVSIDQTISTPISQTQFDDADKLLPIQETVAESTSSSATAGMSQQTLPDTTVEHAELIP